MAAPAIPRGTDRTVRHTHGTTVRSPKPLPPSHPTSDYVYLAIVLAVPGSMIASFLTILLLLSTGEGQLFVWLGLLTLFTVYFGLLGAAWFAEAKSS